MANENRKPIGSSFRRVIILMLIGVGVPLSVLSYLSLTSIRETLVQEWNILQTHIGQSVSSIVGAHVKGSISELAALEAGLREATGSLPIPAASNGKVEAAFLAFLKGGAKAVRVELLDGQGKGVQVGYDFKDESLARRIQDTYKAALASNRPVLSQPIFSTRVNQLLFVVARPILNGATRAGVLLSVVSLEPVLKSIREGSWSGIRVFVVDDNGKLIADLDRNRMIENTDYSQNEIVQALLTNVRGLGTITRPFVDTRGGRKTPMIGTGVLIPETGWAVIAEIPQSQAYAAFSTAGWRILLLTVGALALALALSLFFSHRMLQPLRRLSESAREIANGNYSTELAIEDKSEVGALAQALQEMARQVQQHLAQLKMAAENSRQLFTGTVRALASTIDGKDPYTRGHSERVTRFAIEIAKLLELPEEEVEKIKIAGLIHDIGKIAIDDSILKKPGMLTDEEYQIMKTHPDRGYEMMKHIPQLKDILPGMQSHHEQLDGKGYPRGLKADEIPLLARVIMVADSFDALTTQRLYREPMPTDDVLGMIRSQSGKQYDERVVEALIRGVKTGRIIPHSAT